MNPPNPPEKWLLWKDAAHSPAYNMATDEALLATASRRPPLLRLYGWDAPASSIGCLQTHTAAPAGRPFVRRPTGGGIVLHGDDFTFSVILPPDHRLARLPQDQSYDHLNSAVLRALQSLRLHPTLATEPIPREIDRRTIECFRHPTRYDVLLDDAKVCGAAQRRTPNGFLHQASIQLGNALPDALSSALIAAFEALLPARLSPFMPSPELLDHIQELASHKYSSPDWNLKI